MSKLAAILLFAVSAASEVCYKPEVDISRVRNHNCPCTAKHGGTLRYRNKVLEVCDGSDYVAVGGKTRKEPKTELGSQAMPALSCREILKVKPGAKSGMYFLKCGSSAAETFCYMGSLCSERGWTLIIKADGHKTTFSYDSKVWSNQDTVNPRAAEGGLNERETKLHTYHSFTFDRLCIGVKTGGTTRWQKLNCAADSLYSVLRDNTYHPTSIGRAAWKNLIPGSSLQKNCNKEGFNVHSKAKDATRVRIGIVGNQENDCKSPDSRIGIGGAGKYCGQDNGNSVGNTAKCWPDNGDKNIKSFGYIFAAMPPAPAAGSRENPAESCRDIKRKRKGAKSGMYFLKSGSSAEETYCYMGSLCGERGWTLIIKADGHKTTFSYDSKVWSNQDTVNPRAAEGGLNERETKLHTYHSFTFDRLCIGVKTGGTTRWQKLNYAADSLYSVLRDNTYHPTSIGRAAWKNLIPGSSLQKNCNKEGFNVHSNVKDATRVRIGIVGNQEKDCKSPDSRIGIGGAGKYCGQDNGNSVGNTAKCWPDNGDKNIKSFGYIFAAMPPMPRKAAGSRENPAESCRDVKRKRKDATNGLYYIKSGRSVERVHCHMDTICGHSGWTLLLKANGKRQTFRYDSKLWINKDVYNPDGAAGGLDNQETKLATYHLLPFHSLCVGMRVGGSLRWLKIPQKAKSLYSLIADGRYRATRLGRGAWKSLVPKGSLQRRCNKEGFNVYNRGARARIGIISNNENNCNSPDSRIAFGGAGGHCWQNDKHSVGNEARCFPDNGNRSTAAFGYILAQ